MKLGARFNKAGDAFIKDGSIVWELTQKRSGDFTPKNGRFIIYAVGRDFGQYDSLPETDWQPRFSGYIERVKKQIEKLNELGIKID